MKMKNKNMNKNHWLFKTAVVEKSAVWERIVKSRHVGKRDWNHERITLLVREINLKFNRDLTLNQRKRHDIFITTKKKHLTKKNE